MSSVLAKMLERIHAAKAKLIELESGRQKFNADEEMEIYSELKSVMGDPTIKLVDSFAPTKYGLDVPERLLRQAYISDKDIIPGEGWETGRESDPAFMDMNLNTLRDPESYPKPVLLQFDVSCAMNPRGLVMAYAEDTVLPVVSDFDPFLIGSQGMKFKPISDDDVKLMKWCLAGIKEVLQNRDLKRWTRAWLTILKREASKGFHPNLPEFGFADPSTYRIISDLVGGTGFCGAVRHGSECFNWYFPQELDQEFLVIWDGFSQTGGTPWSYLKESELRSFLIERVGEGFSFPLNPSWVLRDKGWYEVLAALKSSPSTNEALSDWYPPHSGILEEIEALHVAYPLESFDDEPARLKSQESMLLSDQLDSCELADIASLELRRHITLKRAKRKLRAFLIFNSRNACHQQSKPEAETKSLHVHTTQPRDEDPARTATAASNRRQFAV